MVKGLTAAVVLASLMYPSTARAAPTCFGKEATIVGTEGNDEISGTNRDDVVVAFGGADIIRTGRGNDLICAGDGQDSATGRAGHDRIRGAESASGGPGDDLLLSSQEFSSLKGGDGDDSLISRQTSTGHDEGGVELSGGRGRDQLKGGSAPDSFSPGPGRDRIRGGYAPNNIDYLFYGNAAVAVTADLAEGITRGQGLDRFSGIEGVVGSSRGDRLVGSSSRDILDGRGGADTIKGFGGDDHLDGGEGSDFANGGLGNDSCLNAEEAKNCES